MRILVTGASGQLGRYVVDELVRRGHEVVALSGSSTGEVAGVPLGPIDITDDAAVAGAVAHAEPGVIVHLAALARPADAQRDPERAARVNVAATRNLAALAKPLGVRLIFTSTDLAFDGDDPPYVETDAANPLSVYARTKVEAEAAVVESGGTVVRTALMFGPSRSAPGSAPNFFDQQVAALREGKPATLFHDEWRTPLAFCTAAAGIAEVCEADADSDAAAGLFHFGGPERMSRVEFYERLARHLRVEPRYESISRLDIDSPEPRPADVSLDSSKFYATFAGAPRWTMEEALLRMLKN